MNKTLLLVLFWAVSTTLSFGQSGTNLNRATRFAVLASTQVTNSGTTTVTGDLGISPGNIIIDNGALTVTGAKDLGNVAAAGAIQDAKASYEALWASPSPSRLVSPLGNNSRILPGVYKITGNTLLTGFLSLDARSNSDAKFVFLIDGNFASDITARVLLANGAQSQNIFWVVNGSSNVLGNSTIFHGTILAQGDIALSNAVSLTGRVISLGGAVNLNSSSVLQPIQFENDLKVEKTVAEGNYKVDDEVTYTLTATNNGPTNAVGVVVQETIPDGLTFVSATPARGTYNPTTNQWEIGDLENGESVTLTLVLRVTKAGTLENKVAISGEYNDPDSSNDNASVTIITTCPALPATIAITGNTEICDVTQDVTYEAAAVTGATYAFTLPAGWIRVSPEDNTSNRIVVRPTADGVSGTIGVTVTNQCGSMSRGELAVIIMSKPAAPAISGDASACVSETPVTYSVSPVAGETYVWALSGDIVLAPGSDLTGNDVSVIVRGAGSVTVTASNVCGDTQSTLDVVPAALLAAPANLRNTTTGEVCEGKEITLTADAVAGATSYVWTVPADWKVVSTDRTTTTLVVVANSTGTVRIAANNKCGLPGAEATLDVTVTPTAPAPTIKGDLTACINATTPVTYSVDAVAGATDYVWTVAEGNLEIIGANSAGEFRGMQVSVLVKGAGKLTAMSVANTCNGGSTTVDITPSVVPTAPGAITGVAEVCRTSADNAYEVPNVADVTYTWTPPTGWEITAGQGTNRILATAGNSAESGNFTVTATNKCGTSAATPFAVTVKDKPAAPTISGDASACVSETPVTYSVSPVVGETYVWALSGDIVLAEGSDLVGNDVSVIVRGTGAIKVTATNSCGDTEKTLEVVPAALLAAPANLRSNATGEVCEGQRVTFNVDAVAGATTYNWILPAGWVADPVSTSTQLVAIVGQSGTLKVSANNKCGLAGAEATINVTTTALAAAPSSIKGDLTACINAITPVTYSVDAVAGATDYVWTVAEGNLEIVGSNRGTQVSVLVKGEGRLTVTSLTNTCNGGSTTATITPSVVPAKPAAITGPAKVCRNSSNNYNVPVVAGVTYTWTVPTGWTFTESSEGAISATAGTAGNSVLAEAGNITVKATNKCGDSEVTTFAVSIQEIPNAPTIAGDASACIGTPTTYSVTGVAGETYLWSTDGGIAINGASNTAQVSVTATGTGVLTVTATNVCGTNTSSITINPTAKLAAPANLRSNTNGQICQGQEITLTADAVTGATSYVWTVPADWRVVSTDRTTTTLVVAVNSTGVATIAANNKCGAGAEASTTIDVTPTPATPVVSSTNATPCAGTAVTYRVAAVTGATDYIWTVNGNYTKGADEDLRGNEITITLNGPVSIAVAATNGNCAGVMSTALVVNPTTAPATPGAITGPAQVCAGSTGNVFTVNEVASATTYNWILPAGWEIVTGTGTRTITVKAGSAGGNVRVEVSNTCFPTPVTSAPKAVSIATPPAAVASIMDNSTLCDGLSYTIAATPGTTYQWSVPQGFTITAGQGTTTIHVRRDNNAATGNVTVVPSNASGCSGPVTSLPINVSILKGDLEFPKAFSPNNDGINEMWIITNLDKYSENEVVIFNRFGSEVYKKKNYQNDWTGNGLEKGTYFYKVKVKLCNGATSEYTGYTTIFR